MDAIAMIPRDAALLALPAAAFFCYLVAYDLWVATALLSIAVLCVSVARLLQDGYHLYLQRRRPSPRAFAQRAQHVASSRQFQWAAAAGGLLLFQVLVQRDTLQSVPPLLYQALLTACLAVALELGGTSKVHMMRELHNTQTLYSEGAAWVFCLGYLQIIFGEAGIPIADRMQDYVSKQQIRHRDRTYFHKMFILMPMNTSAMLTEHNFNLNDPSVMKEDKLGMACEMDGRKYGESQVYKIAYNKNSYRVAMEVATPLVSAAHAVNDSEAKFTAGDFEEFAVLFQHSLQDILRQKPSIGDQLVLVPIYDSHQLGQCVLQLWDGRSAAADRLSSRPASGSVSWPAVGQAPSQAPSQAAPGQPASMPSRLGGGDSRDCAELRFRSSSDDQTAPS